MAGANGETHKTKRTAGSGRPRGRPAGAGGRIAVAKRNEEIVRLRNEGALLKDIGAAFNLTVTSVSSILKKSRDAGAEVKRFRRAAAESDGSLDGRIVELRREGRTLAEIGAELGLRGGAVAKRLRKSMPAEEDAKSNAGRAARNARIAEMAAAGAKSTEIAETVGVELRLVRQIVSALKRKGTLPSRPKPNARSVKGELERIASWSQEPGARLLAGSAEPAEKAALAESLGLDAAAAKEAASAAKRARNTWIRRLRVQGWTYSALAGAFGLSIERARQIDREEEPNSGKSASKRAKMERDAEILRLRREGMTLKQIAGAVGVSAPTVLGALKKAGRGGVRQERREEALRLYNAGKSAAETARRLGVADMTVRAWIRLAGAAGAEVRPSSWKSREERAARNARILEMREDGAKLREIAEEMKMTIPGVSLVLKRAGKPARPRTPKEG